MVAGKATTPWIAWDESSANGGLHSVFVARLDAAGDHFDLLNNGQPISHSGLDSTRPDIVFSHNTPYVSWHETQGGATTTFVGHFEGDPANPVFQIDTGAIPTTTTVTSDDDLTDVRAAARVDVSQRIRSPRTAPPVPATRSARRSSGSRTRPACRGHCSHRAISPRACRQVRQRRSRSAQATLGGSVNPAGAPVQVRIEFGPSDQLRRRAQQFNP